MELAGYFCTLFAGVILGLLGGGGAILMVPILLYLFKYDAVVATAYSLFIVGVSALVGAFRNYRKGQIDFRVGIVFALPGFLGVFVSRAYIIPNLPDPVFSLAGFEFAKNSVIITAFAVVMILAARAMIFGRKSSIVEEGSSPHRHQSRIAVQGLGVGLVTGFVGAGGGFLIVPALAALAQLPIKTSIGTSLAIIAFQSLLGFLGDVFKNSELNWTFLLVLSGISLGGVFIGTTVSDKVPDRNLKKGFGYFVLIMGLFILTRQFI